MDAESFKRMFLPCHAKLYGVACRLLENAEDAEDLIQEAYLKLWSKREELTLISNPEAFAVTLVKNMCFDLLRSGKYLSDRQHLPLTEAQNALPADGRDAKDDAQLVRMLIARLPRPGREGRRTAGEDADSPSAPAAADGDDAARREGMLLRRGGAADGTECGECTCAPVEGEKEDT